MSEEILTLMYMKRKGLGNRTVHSARPVHNRLIGETPLR